MSLRKMAWSWLQCLEITITSAVGFYPSSSVAQVNPTTIVAKTPKVEQPTQIVEVTGWIVDEDGNIEFVARANHTNPKSPWQNPASCSASQ